MRCIDKPIVKKRRNIEEIICYYGFYITTSAITIGIWIFGISLIDTGLQSIDIILMLSDLFNIIYVDCGFIIILFACLLFVMLIKLNSGGYI